MPPLRLPAAAAALVAAAALLTLAWAGPAGALEGRGWALAGGFAALSAGLALARAGAVAAGFAAGFAVLGGLSAVVAAGDPDPWAGTPLAAMAELGLARLQAGGGAESFAYALRITALGGLAACLAATLAALVAGRRAGERSDAPAPTPLAVERLGRVLAAVGVAGYALALGRFAVTGHDAPTLFGQLKSFWIGGSYFLLLAGFAVPGLGLWLSGALARGGRRSLAACAGLAVVLAVASVPTGQRGFAIQLALVGCAVMLSRGVLRPRALVALAAAGVVALAVTQAVRNAALEQGSVRAGSVVQRLAPDRLRDLLGSQIASFRWTWDVARYRDELDLPGPLRSIASKPIPRALHPGKTQGFGTEFTEQLYPGAAAQQVGFATPLVAEADYAAGPGAVLLVFALLGALAAWLWRWALRGPEVLRPVLATAVVWCAFLFTRGDLANAAVIAAAWVVPLAGVLLVLRRQAAGAGRAPSASARPSRLGFSRRRRDPTATP